MINEKLKVSEINLAVTDIVDPVCQCCLTDCHVCHNSLVSNGDTDKKMKVTYYFTPTSGINYWTLILNYILWGLKAKFFTFKYEKEIQLPLAPVYTVKSGKAIRTCSRAYWDNSQWSFPKTNSRRIRKRLHSGLDYKDNKIIILLIVHLVDEISHIDCIYSALSVM